ncbi:MAG: NADPH-dependent glutamate synthase [Clostridiales bacterium]|jgi:glutamate synthase (NADPH/NADH) small chain|nr:NADPH-dependent glutamate synthase [Clostridiales bacterium]
MPNMSNEKVGMRVQDPAVRNQNFEEVALGYSPDEAREEAERCLHCKHSPCMKGCPVGVKIPDFIKEIENGDFEKANSIIKETNSLPAVCGRVCPQESQCEALCVRGIKGEPVAIGRLERFAADYAMGIDSSAESISIPNNGIKVGIVGAGPAGLACAGDLAQMGYHVTIFEALHEPGGVLVYGIPEFRLPKAIVRKEIDHLLKLGVEIKKNFIVGKTMTLDELFESGYSAIFIGSGAGLPRFMGIPGENLNGVYSANEFLTRVNLMNAHDEEYDTPIKHFDRVAVVGGGNVAMDAARCAKRIGSKEVFIVYRRGVEEMPARLEEIHHAQEEDIVFKVLTNPIEILATEDGWVRGMFCTEMELGQPDSSGRRRPIPVEGSEFVLDVDGVIMALGTSPNPLIASTTDGLKTNRYGCIEVDEDSLMTSRPGVFAGGDAVTGAATVILAMGAGKKAAAAIDEYIKTKN